jgi:prepilin-type N-terminal cleavage/methylation domain-containing protein
MLKIVRIGFTPLKKKKGVTLVEILMALVLFSLIGIKIFSIFSQGVTLWKREKEMYALHQKSRLFLELIAGELRNTVSFQPLDFEGKKNSISFLLFSNRYNTGNLCKINYYFDSQEQCLRRSYQTFSEIHLGKKGKDEKLTAGVEDFNISYAYSKEQDDFDWKDYWESKKDLPIGIKIHLKLINKYGKSEKYSKTIYMPIGKLGVL